MDDPDNQLILQLFPQHVAAAILAKLAEAEEEAAAAAEAREGQEGEAGGGASRPTSSGGGTQLVEVIVDRGRPVRVRLSSRRDLQLDVQFSVEVGGEGGWLGGWRVIALAGIVCTKSLHCTDVACAAFGSF